MELIARIIGLSLLTGVLGAGSREQEKFAPPYGRVLT
jgi:hypothetical protein